MDFGSAEEVGRRIGAVRGYLGMQKPAFAELLGVSVSSIDRWERGELGETRRRQPRQFAELVLEKTGAPRELFGLEPIARDEDRLQTIERSLAELQRGVEALELERELERGVERSDPTDRRTGGQEHGAQSE